MKRKYDDYDNGIADEEEEQDYTKPNKQTNNSNNGERIKCPYLDTIKRFNRNKCQLNAYTEDG